MKRNKDLKIKVARFKRDKRAHISFLLLLCAFLITLPAELLCNVRPILLVVDGKPYFPIFVKYSVKDFGGESPAEPDYRSSAFIRLLEGKPQASGISSGVNKFDLNEAEDTEPVFDLDLGDFEDNEEPFSLTLDDFEEDTEAIPGPSATEEDLPFSIGLEDFEEDYSNSPAPAKIQAPDNTPTAVALAPRDYWMLWPPVGFDYQYISTQSKSGREVLAAPYPTQDKETGETVASSWVDGHYLGTDDRGRDILARLIYGFRISMIFGLSLAITGTFVGCLLGGIQGYFGGWIDLIGQRLSEIWGSIPRLFILIILSSLLRPSALLLFVILNLTAWMGIAAYIRAEFLRTRNLEYVKAARAMGISNFEIMRRHILPNSLTPVITFFPFEVTAGILALVSLDFLNLGVPSPAPSMGELLAQGKQNLHAIWIILPTFVVLTTSLTLLTFVGEGIRNAFDPRKAA